MRLTSPPDIIALKVNDQLAEVIRRLLEKDAANRYKSAEEVANDLRGLPASESYSSRESYLSTFRFIERKKELDSLKAAFENTLLGSGGVYLIGGESDVGKSRLLDEFRIFAQAQGCFILRGQSIREAQPYQLWRDALRRLALATDFMAGEASILLSILPDLNKILGTNYPSAASLGDDEDRKRLYRTIARIFGELEHPIVLILEDLHWAESDLEPLRILAAHGNRLPIMIVGSYRDDEAPNLPAQIPHTQIIRLEGLTEVEINPLIISMLGTVEDHEFIVDFLQRETQGNIFFLIEMLRALAEEAGDSQHINKGVVEKYQEMLQTMRRQREQYNDGG